MKISINSNVQHLFSATSASKSSQSNAETQKEQQKDSVTIGQQAHQLFNKQKGGDSVLETLAKQRDDLIAAKNDFQANAIDAGQDPSSIKDELKNYDKQIAEVEKQMSELHTNKVDKDDDESTKAPEDKTAEDTLLSQAMSLDAAKNLQKISNQTARQIASLDSEIELDSTRGVFSERKINQQSDLENTLQDITEKMKEQLSEEKEETII